MDFHALPRRELQTLCKRNKIAANMTNVAMADALQALPTVEGLETLIQDAQQYSSPKKAAGMPEAPSRSCRRTSTRKQPNPPGSSVPRTTRRAPGEKEAGGEDGAVVVPGVGIPNSPTTLNSRGRRIRTLVVTAGCLETGEEEVEAVKKLEPLLLEIPNTPATRATRARRAANQVAKQEEEDGAPVVTQTPGATAARRASTRRGGARAAPAPVEASAARSTRYRTRRTVVEEAAAETETATRTSRKNSKKGADDRALPGDVSAAGEDSAEGDAPAEVGVEEALIPVAAAGRVTAETEHAALSFSSEPTAEISHPIPEMDGSNARRVDQTVEKNPTDVVVVEDVGVDQMAAEETISDDPTVVDEQVPMVDSIDQTVDRADEAADQTVEVEESHDSTVGDALSDQTVAEETILDDPTVVDEEVPMADSTDQTVEVEESHVDQTVGDDQGGVVEGTVGSFEGLVDQTAVEELILNIAEISLDPTAEEEELPIVAGSEDQTADDGRDLVEFLLEGVEGPVDPTVEDILVLDVDRNDDIDPTVEDGDEISACEEEGETAFPEESPVEAAGVAALVTDPREAKEEEAEKEEIAAPGLVPAVGEIYYLEGEEPGEDEKEEETPMVTTEVGDAEAAAGVPVSLVAVGDIQLLPQEVKEEQAEKEENAAPGLVSAVGEENSGFFLSVGGPPPAETEKAADLVQTQQQPSVGGDAAPYLLGEQDKENAAVRACLSPTPKQNQKMEVVKFDNNTSLRKLKSVYKEQMQVLEEKKKKRAALTALDDNCIKSPSQIV